MNREKIPTDVEGGLKCLLLFFRGKNYKNAPFYSTKRVICVHKRREKLFDLFFPYSISADKLRQINCNCNHH